MILSRAAFVFAPSIILSRLSNIMMLHSDISVAASSFLLLLLMVYCNSLSIKCVGRKLNGIFTY